MYDSDYTLTRMTRFWTYFGMWSCGLYFAINFLFELSNFLFYETAAKPKLYKKLISVSHFIKESFQQAAVAIALSVSMMFWILYFNSPSAVFRITDEWQPTYFEELYYTHFEHTLPLLFLIIDCVVFKQGNTRVKDVYYISKMTPFFAFGLYTSIVVYDYYYYDIKPYPFMDSWNAFGIAGFITSFVILIGTVLNPTAYLLRQNLNTFSKFLFSLF
ncbi:hypothetical protein EIN_155170 [Entamoeba invadens IP1]|uniref:Uncharacterized protein n=1 Tax=Entamoeba invadens IP1 TaxID=370355 RepID=A0A0A1U914_ENTIV|nr:hypothetical protein EIN_155170 [Entamoeba invadens IP1]ELP91410.1 hypothetical protein EIN_155170 [Entamoeba invadens IP1]|eukprot:XP_004258181.1 hypothetical protein EIN_155170 [Entamoeba invadens IP1]